MTARSITPLGPNAAAVRGRILIVVGEGDVARAVQSVADSRGFQVVGVCADPQQALKAAEEMRPNLVVSGIFFNGEPEGIELSRGFQEGLGVPVVFVGSSEDPMLMLQVAMAQPAGYISDALDSAYVEAVLSRALKGVRTTVGSPF